ncbi:glycosyltransferase family 2 protein [Planctomycetota bacterium]
MDAAADIIILTFNKCQYTEFCLKGLLRTQYRPLHVILVDNGSEDRTPELLSQFKGDAESQDIDVTLITNSENIGAIEGRNQALKKCKGEYVIFMDNDVVPVASTWITSLVSFLHTEENSGAVSPKLIYPAEPYLIQCAGCDVSPSGRVNFRGRGVQRAEPEFSSITKVQALITACMAVPSYVIKEVGMFDPLFSPVQFEDIDYCYRIKETGRDLYCFPEVEMYHFENVTTSRSLTLNPVYNTVKNGVKFKKKWEHVFFRENGPDEKTMEWKDIETVDITDIDSKTIFG